MPDSYFNNFPLRTYTLNPEPQPGEYEVVTDIFRRVAPLRRLLERAIQLYTYEIQTGDTPENIAYRYYGSTDYHWVVTMINGIIDPVIDWPKSNRDLDKYVSDLYGSIANAAGQTHHWTKHISKKCLEPRESDPEKFTTTVTTSTQIIDETLFNALPTSDVKTFYFASNTSVEVTTTKSSVDAYTYEQELNESKRNIVILNKEYLAQAIAELGELKR